MLSDKKFINFILMVTFIELTAFTSIFFMPNYAKDWENITFKFFGLINYGFNALFINMLIVYILLGLSYLHRYWITAFIIKCIIIFMEFLRIKFSSIVANMLGFETNYFLSLCLIIEITMILIAIIYIYKFKRLRNYPEFFGILKRRSKGN